MSRRLLIVLIIIAISGTAFGYLIFGKSDKSVEQYKISELTRGDIESTISSTGTLSPITTVQVGTQVSGTIAEVFVDYNYKVKKGQMLAVLDTVLLKISVLDAQAGVDRADAQLEQAQADFDRNQALFDQKLIADSDFLPYRVALKTQKAALTSAEAALRRAKRSLNYAFITSPINGTVIQKNIEAGQTVAASLSTPTLFEIAEDLSQMEILAAVDESDIGKVKVGQAARFEVQAYPDKVFDGTVTQVRLQPETISNVVTYTVVVSASNDENLLFPGMTATVDFIVDQRKDVFIVPNSALRFQPSDKIVEEFMKTRTPKSDSMAAKYAGRREGGIPAEGEGNTQSHRQVAMSKIWYLNDAGKIMMEPVRTGISDGNYTEIAAAHDLTEGARIIYGLEQGNGNNSAASTSRPAFGGRGPRF